MREERLGVQMVWRVGLGWRSFQTAPVLALHIGPPADVTADCPPGRTEMSAFTSFNKTICRTPRDVTGDVRWASKPQRGRHVPLREEAVIGELFER